MDSGSNDWRGKVFYTHDLIKSRTNLISEQIDTIAKLQNAKITQLFETVTESQTRKSDLLDFKIEKLISTSKKIQGKQTAQSEEIKTILETLKNNNLADDDEEEDKPEEEKKGEENKEEEGKKGIRRGKKKKKKQMSKLESVKEENEESEENVEE